jgi:3,4-dihydroxy 2-butanone 4-phosphate synthase/GTP cyclohydrolase II
MKPTFSRIDDAIEAVSTGQIVIVVDSEDRENEGDFLAAADGIDAAAIHFMITHGRGQLCMPITASTAERLELVPMVENAGDVSLPRFTIPLDRNTGTTGISPLERAETIRAIVDPSTRPEDFVRPGHIFPLVARSGGVLERTGHTESAVELARLANLAPAGVLCEICSRDGRNMATRDELFALADEHHLHIITIDDLVEYRQQQCSTESCLVDMVTDLGRVIKSAETDRPACTPVTIS